MAGISDKALKTQYAENKYRFIGQLYDDDLGWDTYQFKFRTEDPQLGRFWQIDPLAAKYAYNSTYAYAENRPIDGIDLEGKEFLRAVAQYITGNTADAQVSYYQWAASKYVQYSESMDASTRLSGSSEQPSTQGPSQIQNVEASLNKMSDWASAAKPALDVLDATATLASFTPVAEAGAPGQIVLNGGLVGASETTISNSLPDMVSRVVPNSVDATTLGRPGAADVFVTASSDIKNMNASQIATRLTIPENEGGFKIIEFKTPEGIATPINRNNPGFVGNGKTAGGAREFVIPNGPVPQNAKITTVR